MPGTVLRPLSVADAPAVIDLVNAAAGQAERRAAMDASGRVRLYRYVPPGAENVVAVDGSGNLVGYACLAYREGLVVQEIESVGRDGARLLTFGALL